MQARAGRPVRAVATIPPAHVPALDSSGPEAIDAPVMTWERALDAWRLKLQSETTRATYASAVRAFFATPGAPDLAALHLETLDAYSGALRLRVGKDAPPATRLAPATVNLKLAGLRSFLAFCRRRGWLSPLLTGEAIADGLAGVRSYTQRPYQIVEGASEREALLDAAAADAYDPARALALIALALGAGLRIAELCALDVGDLANDATGCYVDVRNGKGGKDRQVPIAQDVYEVVAAYLAASDRAVHRTADRATPLFLSRKSRTRNGRLTTRQARRTMMACVHRAGLDARKRITPHGLRHSYALQVLAGDPAQGIAAAPLPAVSKLLGHSSVAVTGRYLAHFERKELSAYAPSLRRGRQAE